MKKLFAIMLGLVMVFGLVGCSATPNGELSDNISQSVVDDLSDTTDEVTESTEDTSSDVEINIAELKQGDEVSIVGQVIGSGLEDGEPLWVKVQRQDGDHILYYCYMKQEFMDAASKLESLNVVKVKGLFLSYYDVNRDNLASAVTLYDCELK